MPAAATASDRRVLAARVVPAGDAFVCAESRVSCSLSFIASPTTAAQTRSALSRAHTTSSIVTLLKTRIDLCRVAPPSMVPSGRWTTRAPAQSLPPRSKLPPRSRRAGPPSCARSCAASIVVEFKDKQQRDPVTAIDRAVEALVRDAVRQPLPRPRHPRRGGHRRRRRRPSTSGCSTRSTARPTSRPGCRSTGCRWRCYGTACPIVGCLYVPFWPVAPSRRPAARVARERRPHRRARRFGWATVRSAPAGRWPCRRAFGDVPHARGVREATGRGPQPRAASWPSSRWWRPAGSSTPSSAARSCGTWRPGC